ncbi:23S rRNA (adenine(2030)-N(6))-methyltransferase RlmJ [Amaricoccus solimangrovi]|uniref:Ribosomal RNA large subunit methyltransferase J n=1 Tax=Amaricoccus solimangrovi TaxID=2589815 RepID=A0A501WRP2_9RHOB|nr:23S rRNA (adenine(2030)-N(6))-methyltransferase RlmJ [Amaricoccus solimangrovi]TPE52129.1 23S rRNA (adenine(2030)-N(6))-methyltransferase RlmJ [Amaricoccus solimangrovi]
MLSYQHVYHAGNAADLHKHIVLAELLSRLTRKPRPISYVETHAGRGVYDLAAPEAIKTGEAARGIDRLAPDAASPYGAALAAFRARHGARAYPGSPALARALLRPEDRIWLMELHPAEHAALAAAMAGGGVAIHRRDGREGVLALAPFKPRRGLVLVDPSYEVKDEYAETAAFCRRLVQKWPEAAILVWYPILPAGRHAELLDGLAALPLRLDETRFREAPERGMTGSGLILINGPHGSEAAFAAAHRLAAPVLSPA